VPTSSECLRSSLLQLRNERAAHPDPGLSKLRGLICEAPKHRSVKILVELQALRGVYGTIYCCSASVQMLSTATSSHRVSAARLVGQVSCRRSKPSTTYDLERLTIPLGLCRHLDALRPSSECKRVDLVAGSVVSPLDSGPCPAPPPSARRRRECQ
jgi:hypothetical protein